MNWRCWFGQHDWEEYGGAVNVPTRVGKVRYLFPLRNRVCLRCEKRDLLATEEVERRQAKEVREKARREKASHIVSKEEGQ